MLKYSLSPNWNVANLKTFGECAQVRLHDKGETIAQSITIEDFVDAENTLYLVPTETGDPPACELQIDSPSASNISIKTIHVVTSCSLLEIYSQSLYLRTEKGELIDEFEGIRSHKFTIILPNGSKHVSLKFMKNIEDLWIFGLQIILEERQGTSSVINLENVNELLSNVSLTDKAQKCKQFFQANQKPAPPSLDSIMSIISKSDLGQIRIPEPHTSNDIQAYIDRRLNLFEQRITEKIDQQTQKLDEILALLHAR